MRLERPAGLAPFTPLFHARHSPQSAERDLTGLLPDRPRKPGAPLALTAAAAAVAVAVASVAAAVGGTATERLQQLRPRPVADRNRPDQDLPSP